MTTASERTPLLQSQPPPVVGEVQETEFTNPNRNGNTRTPSSSSSRQLAPDLLRGVLMALMAMDHTSVSFGVYSHGTGIVSEAASTVITQWNDTIPYILRSATHLCAGGFAMLMGMGIVYFVSSRQRAPNSWKPTKQLWHFSMRTIAMVLVNLFGFQISVALTAKWLWIFNVVLLALAIDYIFVGSLYVGVVYYLEPGLTNVIASITRRSSCETTSDTEDSQDEHNSAVTAAWWTRVIIDTSLLCLAAVSLWAGVWTAPNQGACLVAKELGKQSVPSLPEATLQQQVLGHIIAPPAVDYCKSTASIWYGFMFQQVSCFDLGILSSFPPVGWLPFVFVGVVYGRALLRTTSANKVPLLNLTLSIVFALLFISTRIFQYGNLSTSCLDTSDQHPSHKGNQYFTSFKSFFYIVKYPPSPSFAFLTLSLNFLLLYIFNILSNLSPKIDKLLRSPNNPLLVFGNNPLFFYGVHIWYLTLLTALYKQTNLPGAHPPQKPQPGWGPKPAIGLGPMFVLLYSSLILVMFFICKAYGEWKKTKGRESVWRFL
ncbi:unnamed protein product [Sympodiomycopsis kandeliae]